jgi:hypothetical protein
MEAAITWGRNKRTNKLSCIIALNIYYPTNMSNLTALTSSQLKRAADLKDKIEALSSQLDALLGGSAAAGGKRGRKGGMSAAGRAKIAAAQKARWAKIKSAKPGKPAGKKKFTMSAAARAKIAAAAKARWAKVKATKAAKAA